jgi:type III pantothenate kinase
MTCINSLCIDIGNTLVKIAVFENNQMVHFRVIDRDSFAILHDIMVEYKVKAAILSNVADVPLSLVAILNLYLSKVVFLDHKTMLPVKNNYETKETLGKDRLAAVVGANYLYPDTDLMVIDAGTAITYDIIDHNGQYLGGNISPGISMRYKALHQFTDRLPLLDIKENVPDYGRNTNDAIRAGVQKGIIFEVDRVIEHFKRSFPDLKVLFTGGDAHFFENKLENKVEEVPNLVMIGLHRILCVNMEE